MDPEQAPLSDQAKLWNGTGGRAWVDVQPTLDRMFRTLGDLLVEAACAGEATRVLDVGCGTGSTTLAVGKRLGDQGHAVGIDISGPMIDFARTTARREATPATFVCADAQDYAFEPARFDRIISRFGVMFFEDPVRAFANLRRAAADGAQMRFAAWRSAAENPFMTTAERAAQPLLPNLPARRPGGPGQFSFAEQGRIRDVLRESGWNDIDVRPLDVACAFPEKGLVEYLSRMGPVGRALGECDAQTRERVISTVRAAFEPFVHGPEVRFTAASWMVAAHA